MNTGALPGETEKTYRFEVEVYQNLFPKMFVPPYEEPPVPLPPEPDEIALLNAISCAVGQFYPDHSTSASFAVECICAGNWRLIVAKEGKNLDSAYVDESGNRYNFFGIVHGSDDYYYGMNGPAGMRLLSCVGSIEGYGFRKCVAVGSHKKGQKIRKLPELKAARDAAWRKYRQLETALYRAEREGRHVAVTQLTTKLYRAWRAFQAANEELRNR